MTPGWGFRSKPEVQQQCDLWMSPGEQQQGCSCCSRVEVWVLLLRWSLWCLTCTAPQWHPHRLRVPLKMFLLAMCSLSTLRPHGLSHPGTKTERLNSPVVWILEAVSEITCCNGHLAKSLQRIITCIFKLVKAAEVKLAKILRRTEINFQMSHCNWFLYHCHKVIRSDT